MANYQLARNSFKGKMNKDLDPIEIQNQEYIDALNAQFLSDSEGKTLNIMPVIGNTLAFDLGSVTAQNKKYRIYVPDTGNYEIKIYNIDGITPYDPNGIPVSPIVFSDLTSLQVSIATSLSNSGISFIQTLNTTDMYLEVELTENPYYDYIINSIGVDNVRVIVSQEAIDPSLAGSKIVIGSNDSLGDLFIFSTPCKTLEYDLDIQSISDNGSGLIRIQTSAPHGLQDYEYVIISGVPSNVGASGVWQVNSIDSTRFDLIFSSFSIPYNQGSVKAKYNSVGEIGVATYDLDNDLWSYVRLLYSKELRFTTKKQIDLDSERGGKYDINIYYTDNYNTPRVFYFNGDYYTDAALSINNSKNVYNYGSIDDESYLFIKNDYLVFNFVNQLNSGGNLPPGNKYYTYRLITSTGAYTDWGTVSGPIPVYSASINDPAQIAGDATAENIQTSKINVISYSGIDIDTYKYIEVASVTYAGLATSAIIIGRYTVTDSSIEIKHTGSELGTDISIEEIISKKSNYTKAKNVRIIDNRLTLSNLEIDLNVNLSEWAKTFRHSIKRKTQEDIDGNISNSGNAKFPTFGSYNDPYVVNTQVGYCLNEVDRFAVVGVTKKGYRTEAFWIDDVRFDNNPINTANPFGDNRRNSTIPDYNLTTQTNINILPYESYIDNEVVSPYTFYIAFENINMDFILSDGKRVSDVLDYIEFWRAENIQEVYSGVLMYFPKINTPTGVIAPNGQTIYSWYNPEYPVITNSYAGLASPFRFGKFYMIDNVLNGSGINFNTGNTYLNIFGIPKGMYYQSATSDAALFECMSDCTLPSQAVSVYNPIPTNIPILELKEDIQEYDPQAPGGTQIQTFGSDYYNFYTQIRKPMLSPPSTNGYGTSCKGYLIELDNNGIIFTGPYNDRIDLYVQIINPIQDKYGDIKTTNYIPTQAVYQSDSITTLSSLDVFGGYCFTQKNYIRPISKSFVSALTPDHSFIYSFFSQNRINSQLRALGDESATPPEYVFPSVAQGTSFDDKLEVSTFEGNLEYYDYFDSYTPESRIDIRAGYNEDIDYNEKLPTRIIWSSLKPTGSKIDYYRLFLPLQFKDLEMKYGDITHHEIVNGELFAFQPRNWQREFFNTTGMLTSQDSDSIVLGNSGVMARKGQRISSYGTSNKWSVVKGRTRGGRDQLFWVDQENGVVLRFGADGTNTISLLWGMFSFFNNNLKWAGRYDTPADGEGITGVWNERYQETIYSVRGYRKTNGWTAGREVSYNVGDVVNNGDIPVYGFPSIYICIQEHISTPQTEPGSGELWQNYWELISTDNNNYYNLYSFVISEVKNGFTTFLTPKPLIYLPWKNKYLTPHPSEENSSKIYEENKGDYCVWYKVNDTEISEDAHIESVINVSPMDVKTFVDILSQSEYKPYRVEFAIDLRDSNQNLVELRSYLVENDFDYKEGVWVSPVKNDTTTAPNGTPDEDTSQLYGNYIKVKLFMEKGKFQKLQNYLIKFQFNSRYNAT